jgi:DNA helicase-2/ATP-dependent DNA helicase PcrA
MCASLFDHLPPPKPEPDPPAEPADERVPDEVYALDELEAEADPEELGFFADTDTDTDTDPASFGFGFNTHAIGDEPTGAQVVAGAAALAAPLPADEDPLLLDLTASQRDAVTHKDGPVIVVAGPGSGKTRVLTRRVAYLSLRAGVEPWRILAITFTNKAADEMRERIERLLAGGTEDGLRGAQLPRSGVLVSTFHSFCARMLRRYGPPGRTQDFTIYDTDDQRACMKRVVKELKLDAAQWKPRSLLGRVSDAKNHMIDAALFAEDAIGWRDRTVAKVFAAYEEALAQFNALDFDDLLFSFVRLLEERPDALAELRERFRYVLVDEYQDTNRPQYRIANLLAGEDGNLFVVGDPDQSIYKWRGADIRNILEFERDHPSAREIRLERNYRSTKAILAAAQGLIAHNAERRDKRLFTDNDPGAPLRWIRCLNDGEEAKLVAGEVERRLQEGASADEVAVFYRANALSRRFEEELRNRGIRHVVIGSVPFWQRREVKDVLAYLRLLANPHDEQALMRVFGVTEGVGGGTVTKLQAAALERGQALLETVLDAGAPLKLRGAQKRALTRLRELLTALRAMPEAPARPLLERVVEDTGYHKKLQASQDPQDQARADNVSALIDGAAEFDARYPEGGVRGFLDQAALLGGADEDARDGEAVRLMTLHAAKGLEFDEVYIVGFDDRLLPLERDDTGCDLEEERRLLYVGITRARHRVTLTSVLVRRTWGQERSSRPSRFLTELPEEVLERTGSAGMRLPGATPLRRGGGLAWTRTEASPEDAETILARERRRAALAHDTFDGIDEPADADAAGGDAARRPRSTTKPRPSPARAEALARWGKALMEREQAASTVKLCVGARVSHAVFGAGRVLAISGSGPGRRVKVQFDRGGTKTLVMQYANLERIT